VDISDIQGESLLLTAIGFWLLAFGFWLLAFGFWPLAFGLYVTGTPACELHFFRGPQAPSPARFWLFDRTALSQDPVWLFANCQLLIASSQRIGASPLRRRKSCIKDRLR
jgi:hypothetical protein